MSCDFSVSWRFTGFWHSELTEKLLLQKAFQLSIAAGDSFVLTGPSHNKFKMGFVIWRWGKSLLDLLSAPFRWVLQITPSLATLACTA